MALNLFMTKSPEHLMAEAAAPERQLKRALSVFDLTCIGIGAVIGTGIFALAGDGSGRGRSACSRINLENAGVEFRSIVDNACAFGFWAAGRRTGCYAFICGRRDRVRIRGALLRRTRREVHHSKLRRGVDTGITEDFPPPLIKT